MRFDNPIPGPIVKAICHVKSNLGAVKKNGRNTHGGYNFASTDDIYAECMRCMAAAGLVLLSSELHCEIKRLETTDTKTGQPKTQQWAHFEFGFMLATPEASWTDEHAKRTLYIQVTGPQTFQAAQSYAEKAYLRSLFKIPTGDMDLDAYAQADTEEDMMALASNGRTKRKSSAAAKRDGTNQKFNEIRKAISESINPEMLQHVRKTYADDWAEAPSRWAELLDADYDTKMDDLRGAMI